MLAIAAREGDLVRGDCFGAVLACRTAIVAPTIEHRVVRGVADGVPMLFDAEVAVGVERGPIPRPGDRVSVYPPISSRVANYWRSTLMSGIRPMLLMR